MNAPTALQHDCLTPNELRQILELTVAQIDMALKEAAGSVELLGQELARFQKQTKGGAAAQAALAHIQFFDKLSQRLSHARHGMEMAIRRTAQAPATHSAHWTETTTELRQFYSTADERVLFDFYFKGLTRGNFLQALGQMQESSRSGELDLF